jgi:hypothetical protein
MTPAEVLRKAADLIAERGWWNGRGLGPFPGDGPHCVLGAVGSAVWFHQAAGRNELYFAAMTALHRSIGSIADWNDAQPNGEVVIAKLREVADELERAS